MPNLCPMLQAEPRALTLMLPVSWSLVCMGLSPAKGEMSKDIKRKGGVEWHLLSVAVGEA